MDKDIVVFKTDPSHEHIHPTTGDYLGDLTNTIYKVRGLLWILLIPCWSITIQSNNWSTVSLESLSLDIVRDGKSKTIHTVDSKKDYRVVFTKRICLESETPFTVWPHRYPVLPLICHQTTYQPPWFNHTTHSDNAWKAIIHSGLQTLRLPVCRRVW